MVIPIYQPNISARKLENKPFYTRKQLNQTKPKIKKNHIKLLSNPRIWKMDFETFKALLASSETVNTAEISHWWIGRINTIKVFSSLRNLQM